MRSSQLPPHSHSLTTPTTPYHAPPRPPHHAPPRLTTSHHTPPRPTIPHHAPPYPTTTTVILPDAVTCRNMPVTVELSGAHTRGMTVCDLREFVMEPDEPKAPSAVGVSVEVDAERMKEVFRQAVLLSGACACACAGAGNGAV